MSTQSQESSKNGSVDTEVSAKEGSQEETKTVENEGSASEADEEEDEGEVSKKDSSKEKPQEIAAVVKEITEQADPVLGTIGEVMKEMEEEALDPDDIEQCQRSSGSEDEELNKTRVAALQRMQYVMTKPSDIQDPNKPRIAKDEDKELMEEMRRSKKDKAILQSMTVAERGYITRLRPLTPATDKLTLSQYQIRPGLEDKFKSLVVKEMIHTVLNDELGGKEYTEEEAKVWSQSIANTIRMKVKEMGFPRYKFVVQCVIGEERGAGVKIGSRCLWDADTDNYASDTFLNETIFCMTAVYAIYFY